ncbi:hypothetical protein [Caviibacterium pharyngocola]|uniref:Uncharacterized protein n=1 Tax=Caviibacterium pharyngocola TaxID=28159 RepID=A0A2M8RY10_9PAST|nr:hypothetical protein [Caviibacterium pharyngocola]PJG83766.1 hypothetical protein CVP04_01350 [Caviibacterium pharyngocola]
MDGRLLLGVPYNGTLHFDFKVKLLSLAGECQALEWAEELDLPEEEKQNREEKLLHELCFLVPQLDIDGIPETVLTPRFLLQNLSPSDYVLVWGQLDNLRKKHIDAGANPENPA